MTDDASDIREKHLRSADFLGAFGVIRREERTLFVANERVVAGESVRVWDLPGGQVEPGELLHEALTRELDEELGIAVAGSPDLLFVQEGERVIDGLRQYAWRTFFYRVTEFAGEPRAQGEVLDHRWMTDAEALAELTAPYHDSYRQWLERGGTAFRSRWID